MASPLTISTSPVPLAAASDVPLSDYSVWDPKQYLAEYYAHVMPDEKFALEFLVEAARRVPAAQTNVMLEFGCGPTVHHLFPLADRVGEIHLAEYHSGNRAEIEGWLARKPGAPDWVDFAKETLLLENGNAVFSDADARTREELVRARVTRVLPGDAFDRDPLGANRRGFYPLVATHYCAEAITRDIEQWRACMGNISGLVAPGGILLLSACGAADYYTVGERYFPCAGVRPADVLDSLIENGFGAIDLRVRQVPDHSEQGYSSVIFASGVKTAS